MKTLRTTCIAIFAFSLYMNCWAQAIWIADNNFNAPTGANVFPTIQEAIDAASAGDIVHVQPSPTTYVLRQLINSSP